MLNRLYIVVGLLAIAILTAAFIVPRFVQWGDYRERMEILASEALGTDVRISGDIAFTLLPQPRLKFGVVTVGPVTSPVMTVNDVEAELSLLDFLRDRYTVTRLTLNQPTVDVAVDTDGSIDFSMPGTPGGPSSQVTLTNALINDGQLRLTDRRSGSTTAVDALAGELRFVGDRQAAFSASGQLGGRSYVFRFSTQPAEGGAQLSAFARPADESFSMAVEGTLSGGQNLRFEGTAALRVAPPALQAAGGLRGPMVFAGKINATTELVTFTDYTLTPDENRAATRLTGAANLSLGTDPAFSAVISGGVFALPPRDATEDEAGLPVELVRLLGEVPAPFTTFGIPGRVGLDITEFNLRATSLRNLRIDATTDGEGWQIETFRAQLPGSTTLSATGTLSGEGRQAIFDGQASFESQRLDVLAAAWHPPATPNLLFGASASYRADVSFRGSSLALSNGLFTLGGQTHRVSATVGGGETPRLSVDAAFDELGPVESAQVEALLPLIDARATATFPDGDFALTAKRATVNGLDGEDLALRGDWGEDGITVALAQAGRLGDGQFLLSGSLSGTVQDPQIVANGRISVPMADAPILGMAFQQLGLPTELSEHVRRSTPLELDVTLSRPGADGAQALHAEGRAGAAALALDASLSQGLPSALSAPLRAKISLASADPAALTRQFSLGPLALVEDGTPLRIAAELQGQPTDGLAGSILITGGETYLAFDGGLGFDGERLTGNGSLNFALEDLTPVAAWMGVERMQLPGITGRADVVFGEEIRVSRIDAQADGRPTTGDLLIEPTGDGRQLAGTLSLGEIDLATLVGSLAGPAALLQAPESSWPDGPIDIGEAPPELSGRVEITAPMVLTGDREVLSDASFVLGWSKGEVRLTEVAGRLGGGTVTGNVTLCCSGPLPDKQVEGRVSLDGVDLAAVLDGATATSLSGTLTLGAQFNSTGASIFELARGLSGEGSYQIEQLEISDLNPAVFSALAATADLGAATPDRIESIVEQGLAGGIYAAPQLSGGFRLAGGVLRSPNIILSDATTRLSGALGIDLGRRELNGDFTLLPKGQVDPAGLVSSLTAPLQIRLEGALDTPARTLELDALVGGISNKALEIQLAELERLRLEEEARSRAAAEERSRLILRQKREQAVANAAADIGNFVDGARSATSAAALDLATSRLAELATARDALEDALSPAGPLQRPIDLMGLPPPANRF